MDKKTGEVVFDAGVITGEEIATEKLEKTHEDELNLALADTINARRERHTLEIERDRLERDVNAMKQHWSLAVREADRAEKAEAEVARLQQELKWARAGTKGRQAYIVQLEHEVRKLKEKNE